MRIKREGRLTFGDAKLVIMEEGLGGSMQQREDWERLFKKQVFKRIIQQLNRLGWTATVPDEYVEQYSLSFARNYRYCTNGDLQGFLRVSGRCIELEFWQAVNTPTRPDHGGRYESDKEAVMPYLLRLRMERTRRKIRDYLLNVFDGYEFHDHSPKSKSIGRGGMTSLDWIQKSIEGSCHFAPELGRAPISNPGSQDISADGHQLEHGITRVYGFDYRGRAITGIAYYSLNGNWYVLSGKYTHSCHWHNTLYVDNPGDLRRKRNEGRRRARLEGELSKAIKAMNFKRAEVLKNILFPPDKTLYVVKNEEGLYHRANFCGYTNDIADAGKFMADEIGGYAKRNQVIPLNESEQRRAG